MSSHLDLPVLGVGLAADISSTQPDFRKLLAEGNGAYIDYLNFGAHVTQKRRVQHYIGDLIEGGFPLVFHPINFNVCSSEPEPEGMVRDLVELVDYSSPAWAGQDVAVWMFEGQYLGSFLLPPILDDESVEETAAKVRTLNQLLPCPFLIENPPVILPVGGMHMVEFMTAVAETADCGLVLDIGHLIGYQQAAGLDVTRIPVNELALDRVVEVHVAGLQQAKVGDSTHLLDQHAYPVDDLCWSFLEDHASKMVNLKGVTLEQEFCPIEIVEKNLHRAREVVAKAGVLESAH